MVTEMGDEGPVPTVSISEHGEGVCCCLKSTVLSLRRNSPFMSAAELDALDKIVSIPKLDPLDDSMFQCEANEVFITTAARGSSGEVRGQKLYSETKINKNHKVDANKPKRRRKSRLYARQCSVQWLHSVKTRTADARGALLFGY